MINLLYETPHSWIDAVLENFDAFLIDHAAAEKKASGMANSMLSHYPDKPEIVTAMIDLAIEEMNHFREVVKILMQRGLILGPDRKDHYVIELRNQMRKGSDVYMLDRLLIGGIIEARGCERFGLIARALVEENLKKFYVAISESESRHQNLFVDLALVYFDKNIVERRLGELLETEATICKNLPITAALH